MVSEGEGFTSVDHWRQEHKGLWEASGIAVSPDTEVICYSFKVLDVLRNVA